MGLDGGSTILDGSSTIFVDFHHFLSIFTIYALLSRFTFCRDLRTFSANFFGQNSHPATSLVFLMYGNYMHRSMCRLQRWSFFSCDAMAMFDFLQRCDIDYFWTFPTIAIVAIIFPNHQDRLFCDVCIILRFFGGVLRVFGDFGFYLRVLEVLSGVLRGLGGFLRGFGGFWGFSRLTSPS